MAHSWRALQIRATICGIGIGTFLGSIGIPFLQTMVPTERWIQVAAISIADVPSGECPTMIVQRSINQSFVGRWSYTLYQVEDHGTESVDDDRMVLVASKSGERDYLPSEPTAFAARITNRLGVEACPLDDGRYMMVGRVKPQVFFWQPAEVSVQSNVFTVGRLTVPPGNLGDAP